MAGRLRLAIVALALLAMLAGCATSRPSRLAATVERQRQADQAYVTGNLAQALSGYQALTRAWPQQADYWFRLGNVYARLQRPDAAVDAYAQALRIEPTHAKAWHNLGIIRLRQAEAAFGQSAHAAAGIDAALQQDSAAKVRGIETMRRTETSAEPTAGAGGDTSAAGADTGAAESSP